jgi:glycosyltransferase involved in cell wall biosynthesis
LKKLRIAAFGFRSMPLRPGCAGADKFALELLPRLAARGHDVVAYNRLYPGQESLGDEHAGVRLRHFRTTGLKGFDTLLHSAKACWDILRNDTGDIVHIQNGGNSIFALVLRLFGKKVFLSQDGADWKRDKWPWYGKIYLWLSSYLTAFAANAVIFDNVFCRRQFEQRFNRRYDFIPFGSEVDARAADESILIDLGLQPGGYFLFVGRFIPDKGLQYLVPAFEQLETDKKLVLVGGSPNPSDFEREIMSTTDPRILFPGFVYGTKVHALMMNAYAYVQPSDIEGLSPVVLENMGLGTPVICSDIEENRYVVADTGVLFRHGNVDDLRCQLRWALQSPRQLRENAARARQRAGEHFSWDRVTEAHEIVFGGGPSPYNTMDVPAQQVDAYKSPASTRSVPTKCAVTGCAPAHTAIAGQVEEHTTVDHDSHEAA